MQRLAPDCDHDESASYSNNGQENIHGRATITLANIVHETLYLRQSVQCQQEHEPDLYVTPIVGILVYYSSIPVAEEELGLMRLELRHGLVVPINHGSHLLITISGKKVLTPIVKLRGSPLIFDIHDEMRWVMRIVERWGRCTLRRFLSPI